eukprot:g33315.t1
MGNVCCEVQPQRHEVSLETFKKSKIDLVLSSIHMINFLTEVDHYPCLYTNEAVLVEAVRRYETIWLPLVARSGVIEVVPPLDVEWIWHCHMLSPVAYQEDARKVTGVVPDHRLMPRSGEAWQKAQQLARHLWQQQTSEPFDVAALATAPLEQKPLMYPTKLSHDLVAAAKRQMSFHYQVAVMPHYRDIQFLELAVERYLDKFLELKKRHPKDFWTFELCGCVLPHDDSVNDRSAGSRLESRWEQTQKTWQAEFGEVGPQTSGGMFRGNVTLRERALRPVQRPMLWTPAKGAFRVEPQTEWRPAADGTEWLHRKDALTPLSQSINRYSKTDHFIGHVCHGKNCHGKHFSYIEVSSISDQPRCLPLITAHSISHDQLPGPLQVRSKIPTLSKNCLAYLLRVACEDVAIVLGTWSGFEKSWRKSRLVEGTKQLCGLPREAKGILQSLDGWTSRSSH